MNHPTAPTSTPTPTIEDVQKFWNNNPLFEGELETQTGSPEWFGEFDRTQTRDVFVRDLSDLVHAGLEGKKILEVGCGPGFMSRQICKLPVDYTAVDLAPKSIELARKGHQLYGLRGNFIQGNAESLPFESETFDHVISIGVIHHTPDTQKCIDEIYRVLKKGGTGVCSVYYKNILLQNKFLLQSVTKIMEFFNLGLKGRGREKMWNTLDASELVRMYDGYENPVGKAYSIPELKNMFSKFEIHKFKQYFFPARALRIPIPRLIHRLAARSLGLMIQVHFQKIKNYRPATPP